MYIFRFCGNGFDSSIDSHLNYLAFTFKSDQTDSGGGFQATVRLITGNISLKTIDHE